VYLNNNAPTLINYNGTTYSLANYKTASGQDAHSVNADPVFQTAGSDFHLQVSSPAIDLQGTSQRYTTYVDWDSYGSTLMSAVVDNLTAFDTGYHFGATVSCSWAGCSGAGGGVIPPVSNGAGTTGQIAYYPVSGNSTAGTSDIYDNRGNIGIGTTSGNGVLNIYANGGQPDVRLGSSDTYSWQIQRVSTGNLNFNNASNSSYGNQVTFQDASGNVGMGSANPQQKLDVVGTAKATRFVGDGSGLTGVKSQWSNGASFELYYMSGNVGIGSATPGRALDVVGSGYFNGNIGVGTGAPRTALDVIGTVRASNFKSADGTQGATVTTCTGFKNGLCISGT
jgi:hypothetical protein